MFFFFTCGTGDYSGRLHGYEHMALNCPNCHKSSSHPIKRRVFLTFCFIPVVPLKWNAELRCHVCNYHRKISKEELHQMQQNPPLAGHINLPLVGQSPMPPHSGVQSSTPMFK